MNELHDATTAQSPEQIDASVFSDQGSAAPAPFYYRWRYAVVFALMFVLLALDQGSKLACREALARPLPPVSMHAPEDAGTVHYRAVREVRIINGIFHLRYVENPAAAFSLTHSIPITYRRPLLVAISALAIVFLLGWLWRLREPDLLIIVGLACLLSGAVGNNILDRTLHGYVIDFIDWRLTRFFPSLPPWPTFNIADVAIVIGAGAIIFRSFVPFPRAAQDSAAEAVALEHSPTDEPPAPHSEANAS